MPFEYVKRYTCNCQTYLTCKSIKNRFIDILSYSVKALKYQKTLKR